MLIRCSAVLARKRWAHDLGHGVGQRSVHHPADESERRLIPGAQGPIVVGMMRPGWQRHARCTGDGTRAELTGRRGARVRA